MLSLHSRRSVSPLSPTPLSEIYSTLTEADKGRSPPAHPSHILHLGPFAHPSLLPQPRPLPALFDQIRRFRGPWLLSSSSDSNDKIVCCSNPFVSQMGYPEGELVGENCKKLQQGCLQGAGEWNGIHNKTLRESFAKVRPQRGVANTMSAYTPKDLPYALLQRRFYAANATSKTPLAQLIALFLEC